MARPTPHPQPVSTGEGLAAGLAIASGALFVLLLLSLHLLAPGFEPTRRFVSEYAVGTFGWTIGKWLLLTAGIMLVAMVALILLLPRDGQFDPGVLAGRLGRFLLVSYLGWIVTIGLHTLKLPEQAE